MTTSLDTPPPLEWFPVVSITGFVPENSVFCSFHILNNVFHVFALFQSIVKVFD